MLSTRRSHLNFNLVAVGLLLIPTTMFAADPLTEMLRVTPPDTSLGLLVRDLRGHHNSVAGGPLATAFRASPVGKGITAAPELAQIDELAAKVAKIIGMDLSKLRDDVFGDAVVLAYQNANPSEQRAESALLLTWARDPAAAAMMFDRLNEAQKKSGELKSVEALQYRGETIYHRVKVPQKGPDEYYFQRNSIVAFSQQAVAIRHVIDLDLDPSPAPLVLLDRYEADKAFATLWVNPRSFDAELAEKVKKAEAGEAAFLKTFQQVWKATDGIALTLRLENHLELNLNVVTRPNALPPSLQHFGAMMRQPSALARLLPSDTMFAMTGQIDLAATIELVSTFLTADAQRSLKGSLEQSLGSVFGKATVAQLPGNLGPDWGVCITAPPADSKAVLPHVIAALRIRPGKDAAKVEQSLLDAMNKIANFAEIAYNLNSKDELQRKTARYNDVDVVYLTANGLPPGFQPAYSVHHGFLFVATSPDAIGRLKLGKEPVEDRLLFVSFRNIDRYLKDRGEGLKPLLAAHNKISPEEAARQIAQLRAGMELLDRLELVNESKQPGRAKLTLRLHFTAALRK